MSLSPRVDKGTSNANSTGAWPGKKVPDIRSHWRNEGGGVGECADDDPESDVISVQQAFGKTYKLTSMAGNVCDDPGHHERVLLMMAVEKRERTLEECDDLIAWPGLGRGQRL